MGRSGIKRTHEEFLEELLNVNPDIEVLGHYKKAHEKILVRCKIHNYEYYAEPNNLLQGKKCKFCKLDSVSKSKRKDFDKIIDMFKERGYILLSTSDEYINSTNSKLRYLCEKHGEQTISWGNFQQGKGCKLCAIEENALARKKNTWIKIEKGFENSEYKLLSTFAEYTKSSESCLRCLCEIHGEFNISWSNFKKFQGCPVCNSSTGEHKIFHYLKSLGVNFIKPYYFDDLIGVGGRKLSYDFYLPEYNLLIEYQGQQHEKPVEYFGKDYDEAKANFEKQQEHDRRKREYANKNNYNLLEIWYYDFKDIEVILSEKLTIQN